MEIIPDLAFSEFRELEPLLKEKDFVFFDEAQFICPLVMSHILDSHSPQKTFAFYGLRNDYTGQMWPSISILMNEADSITEFPCWCQICGKEKASFNRIVKKLNDSPAALDLGFHFVPACRTCFKIPQAPEHEAH